MYHSPTQGKNWRLPCQQSHWYLQKFSGEAEAFAIEAKAKATAEQMAKKADAWKEYKEAAMVNES